MHVTIHCKPKRTRRLTPPGSLRIDVIEPTKGLCKAVSGKQVLLDGTPGVDPGIHLTWHGIYKQRRAGFVTVGHPELPKSSPSFPPPTRRPTEGRRFATPFPERTFNLATPSPRGNRRPRLFRAVLPKTLKGKGLRRGFFSDIRQIGCQGRRNSRRRSWAECTPTSTPRSRSMLPAVRPRWCSRTVRSARGASSCWGSGTTSIWGSSCRCSRAGPRPAAPAGPPSPCSPTRTLSGSPRMPVSSGKSLSGFIQMKSWPILRFPPSPISENPE